MKKFLEWLRHPHGWLLLIFYILTAAVISGTIVLCVLGYDTKLEVLAYFLFALSALMFAYTVYTLVYFVSKIRKWVINLLKKIPITKRLLEQYGFRTVVFAGFTFVLNLANATINFVIAVMARSVWFGALASYYTLLTVLRGGIMLYYNKKRKIKNVSTEKELKIREIRRYRICGVLLTFLPLCLSGAIVQMIVVNRAFEHAGLAIYVAAAYTFYKIIMSVYNFFKARKTDEMTVRAIRNINVADTLVSVLALQTAMFREFGEGYNPAMMNALTGGIVCLLTVVLGIFMIVNAGVKLKKLKATPDTDEMILLEEKDSQTELSDSGEIGDDDSNKI